MFDRAAKQILMVSAAMLIVTASDAAEKTADAEATYCNPVGGDIRMGDPFLLVHQGTYYLYGTTDSGEGFRAWSSTNLTDWEALGFAYRKEETSWGQQTFWAPEVFRYRDRFYMVFSSQPARTRTFSTRICLAASDQPEGPFRDVQAPLFDMGWSCIDGHVFVDKDGSPYLFFDKVGTDTDPVTGGRYLYGLIYAARLSEDLRRLLSEPVLCVQADQGWEHPQSQRSRCNEGAYVFRDGEKYYLTYSANHYADPYYGIGYATAESPLGPWTKSEKNPLVERDPDRGISGPGHNAVFLSPDGRERFMVYHTHADPERPSGNRVVNLDRLEVRPDGSLRLLGPTRTPQLVPSRP